MRVRKTPAPHLDLLLVRLYNSDPARQHIDTLDRHPLPLYVPAASTAPILDAGSLR